MPREVQDRGDVVVELVEGDVSQAGDRSICGGRPYVTLSFSGRSAFDLANDALRELEGLAVDDHESRCRTFTRLAIARAPSDPTGAAEAAFESRREADLAGTDLATLWARFARCVSDFSPESAEQRVADATSILTAEPHSDLVPLIPTAYFMLLGALTELGRIAELDEALEPGGRIFQRHPELERSRHAAWFRCVRATLDGRIDAAEAYAAEGAAIAEAAGDTDGASVHVGQLAVIRWMQDRVSELEPLLLHARHMLPGDFIWSATLAWVWLNQGRTSAARGLVRMIPKLDSIARDRNWLAALSILGVVAAKLEDRHLAKQLVPMLTPFSDRLAPIGLGVTVWGTVARPLAMLHSMLGDAERAEAYYRGAIHVCTVAGAHAWLAECQLELAELLHRVRGPGAGNEASDEIGELLAEATATARALHLAEVEQRASRLATRLGQAGTAQTSAVQSSAVQSNAVQSNTMHTGTAETDTAQRPLIRVIGDFSVVSLNGEVATWQSKKARELLKVLASKRGAVVPKETIMDLLWPGEQPERLANRLSVALLTVRRALDPEQREHRNTFVMATRDSMRLNIDRCSVDIETWFDRAAQALACTTSERAGLLTEVLEGAGESVFADDPDAVWADRLRNEVRGRVFVVAYELVDEADRLGDHLKCVETYRWILGIDPYDQRAHHGLIESYDALAAHGQANEARAEYARRMAELGISVESGPGR